MRTKTGFVLGLLLALGLAGCGAADGNEGVATAGSPGATSSAQADQASDLGDGVKFAQCMRENGIDMPDPEQNEGGGFDLSMPEGTSREKADAAQEKCKQFLPNGGEQEKMDPERLEQLRKFAKCMRENGLPEFPDPTEYGIQIDGNNSDLDPNSPTFKAAEKACAQYQPAPPSGEPTGGSVQRRNNG